MTTAQHEEFKTSFGKYPYDMDFYELVAAFGECGDGEDTQWQWYLLDAFANKLKQIEDKIPLTN